MAHSLPLKKHVVYCGHGCAILGGTVISVALHSMSVCKDVHRNLAHIYMQKIQGRGGGRKFDFFYSSIGLYDTALGHLPVLPL